jgi:hypothetical protein
MKTMKFTSSLASTSARSGIVSVKLGFRVPTMDKRGSRLSRAVNSCPRQLIDEALLHATRNRRGDTGGLSGGPVPTSVVYAALTYGREPPV